MIESSDGRFSISHVCVGSHSDRFDDDEDWEIRVIHRETGLIVAKASYRDKYSIMMGSMDSGEPRAIAFSPDSTELWLTDEDGRKRTIPVAPPEPSVRELTTPNGADLTWDEAGRTEDGDWTEIQYEVTWEEKHTSSQLGGRELIARVNERTGETAPAPIERIVLSPLGRVLVIVRSDGTAEGVLHDVYPPRDDDGTLLTYSPESWFKAELVTGPLRWGDDSDTWSMLCIWTNRTRKLVEVFMNRDLETGEWRDGSHRVPMKAFRFLPGFQVEIEYEDGHMETRPYGDLVEEVDYNFRLGSEGRYAMVWAETSYASEERQVIHVEIMDRSDSRIILDREIQRAGFEVVDVDLGPAVDGGPGVLLYSREALVGEVSWQELLSASHPPG